MARASSDPFAHVREATLKHRAKHGCGAYPYSNGPLLSTIAAAVGAKRILELHDEPVNLPVEVALKHLPELSTVLLKTLRTRTVIKRQDLRWSYKDQPRLLGYSTLLIQDTQGNFTGVGLTFQDLTSVKR